MEPYLFKKNAGLIAYHIQTNESIHLSEKSLHDIYTNVYQAVINETKRAREREQYWHQLYLELKKKGFPLNWNEMKIRIAWEKDPIPPDVILKWMLMRENNLSIRCLVPDDQRIIQEIIG